MLIYNKSNRDNSFITRELINTYVYSIIVDPQDQMTIVLNSSLGISVYRFQNEKFKIIYDCLMKTEENLKYLSIQFSILGKSCSVLNVLDNNNYL